MQQSVFPFLSSMTTESLSVDKISMEHLRSFPIPEGNFLNYMQTEAPIGISPTEKTTSFVLPMGQTTLPSFLFDTITTPYLPLAKETPQLYPIIPQDPQLPEVFFLSEETLAKNNILFPPEDIEDLSFRSFPMLRENNLSSEDISNSDIPMMSSEKQLLDLSPEVEHEEDVLQNMPTLSFPKDNESFFLEDKKIVDNVGVILPVLPKDKVFFYKDNAIDNIIPTLLTPFISLEDNNLSKTSSPILQDITLFEDNTKDIASSLGFVLQEEKLVERSAKQTDILLSDENMMLSTEDIFVALQYNITPQKTVFKDNISVESVSLQNNNILQTVSSQEDIKLLVKDIISSPTKEKDMFSKESEEGEEMKADSPFAYDSTTEEKVEFSFIPIQSDMIPKLPVIFESSENKDILDNKKSQFSVSDISLPLLSYKEVISQEKYGFEQGDMIRADNDFYHTIKGQDNLSVNKIDMETQNITEFLKSDNLSSASQEDKTVPQDKMIEDVNPTEEKSLTRDVSFVEFKEDKAVSQDKKIESVKPTEEKLLTRDVSFVEFKEDKAVPQDKKIESVKPTEEKLLTRDVSFVEFKEDKAVSQDKKIEGVNPTEEQSLTRDVSFVEFKEDKAVPQDKKIEGINPTEEQSLTRDVSFVESQDVFLPNDSSVTIEDIDNNKKDTDSSLGNLVSKSDNITVTDKIFSIPEKAGEFISNPFATINGPASEPHKIKESIVSAQIPLEKGITLQVTHFKENPEQIGINLEPAGLGKAELIIENHDNMVTAIIRSDKIEVLDLIRKEAPSLERHLSNSGLNLSGGSLRFEQGGGQGHHPQHSHVPQNVPSMQLPLENNALQNDISQTLYQKLASVTVHGGMDMRL